MGRYINYDAFYDYLVEHNGFQYSLAAIALEVYGGEFMEEVEPVKHGKWIPKATITRGHGDQCSECGWYYQNSDVKKFKRCPECGAIMEGK